MYRFVGFGAEAPCRSFVEKQIRGRKRVDSSCQNGFIAAGLVKSNRLTPIEMDELPFILPPGLYCLNCQWSSDRRAGN